MSVFQRNHTEFHLAHFPLLCKIWYFNWKGFKLNGGNVSIFTVLTASRQGDFHYQHDGTVQRQRSSTVIGTRQPSSWHQHILQNKTCCGSSSDLGQNKPFSGDQCSCPLCGHHFQYLANMKRHLKIHLNDRRYKCSKCGTAFYRPDHLKVHERKCKGLMRTSLLPAPWVWVLEIAFSIHWQVDYICQTARCLRN